MVDDSGQTRTSGRGKGLYWLFALPLIAVVFPSLYNFWEPTFFGMPFFYWYQFLWVLLTAGITYFIFRREEA